jgi:hypothetical protein
MFPVEQMTAAPGEKRAVRRPCAVCGEPSNHGWVWRTDCGAHEHVDGDQLVQPMDHPTNCWVAVPWEPIRRARIDRAVGGLVGGSR